MWLVRWLRARCRLPTCRRMTSARLTCSTSARARSLPLIWHGMKSGLADLRGTHGRSGATPRTDQDLSMKFVIGGVILLLLVIMIAPQLHLQWNLLGALLIVVIGFLFVTVSSHLTGEIGSSSCPTSGMTVATLLLTCLVFLIVGWTGPKYFVT